MPEVHDNTLPPAEQQSPVDSASTPSLSVVVPVWRESREKLVALVDTLQRARVLWPFDSAVYLVYDTEDDPSVPVIRDLCAASGREWLHGLHNTVGRGYANALRAGFRHVKTGPLLVTMADLSDDLSTVPELIRLYAEGATVVCPCRYMPGGGQTGSGWIKQVLAYGGSRLLHATGFPVRDVSNNFRLYDAALINAILDEPDPDASTGPAIALELTVKAWLRKSVVVETPTVWRGVKGEASSFSLRKILPAYLKWVWVALRNKPF